MQERTSEKIINITINEPLFDEICQAAPILRSVRKEQKGSSKISVELFINLFEKFRGLNYEQNLDRKYEFQFNIIEIGNLIDAMAIQDELPALLQTIKDYRNVAADGCHALSKEDSDGIIRDFCNFLRSFNDKNAVKKYEENFQRTSSGKKLFSLMKSGTQEQKNTRIVKLLSSMNYFFDKARQFVLTGNIDAACLAYIAGANCARDFKRFYCEGAKLNLVKCLALPIMNEKPHVHDILVACQLLNIKRDDDFAHLQDGSQKMVLVKYLQEELVPKYDELFTNGLYPTINSYLTKECQGAVMLPLGENSPRAYESQDIKKRIPAVEEGASLRGRQRTIEVPEAMRDNVPSASSKRGRDDLLERDRGRDRDRDRDRDRGRDKDQDRDRGSEREKDRDRGRDRDRDRDTTGEKKRLRETGTRDHGSQSPPRAPVRGDQTNPEEARERVKARFESMRSPEPPRRKKDDRKKEGEDKDRRYQSGFGSKRY